jgi:hypothetical protein
MNKKRRFTLEPELEEETCLMNASQRRALANKLRRWARELEVSARMMDMDNSPKPKPRLKWESRQKIMLN